MGEGTQVRVGHRVGGRSELKGVGAEFFKGHAKLDK